MKKTLMHRDKPVCTVEFLQDGMLFKIVDIINKDDMPLGCPKDFSVDWLREWWKNNAIPAYRDSVKRGLAYIGVETEDELKLLSRGLSLTNHYWLKDENESVEWRDVNFWDNGFSEEVGEALFNNKPVHSQRNIWLSSPEPAANGQFRKKWISRDDGFYLLKLGSGYANQEAFNEELASNLFMKAGIPCVEYTVESEGDRLVSCCKCMTDKNHELIPFIQLMDSVNKDYDEDELDYFFKVLDTYNVFYDKKTINDMLAIDYMIANKDRHYNNISVIYDNRTKLIELAPMYDNGSSMWSTVNVRNKDLSDDSDIIAKPFCGVVGYWDRQREYINEYPNITPMQVFDALYKYAADLSSYTDMDKERISLLVNAVVERGVNLQVSLIEKQVEINDEYLFTEENVNTFQENVKSILNGEPVMKQQLSLDEEEYER